VPSTAGLPGPDRDDQRHRARQRPAPSAVLAAVRPTVEQPAAADSELLGLRCIPAFHMSQREGRKIISITPSDVPSDGAATAEEEDWNSSPKPSSLMPRHSLVELRIPPYLIRC